MNRLYPESRRKGITKFRSNRRQEDDPRQMGILLSPAHVVKISRKFALGQGREVNGCRLARIVIIQVLRAAYSTQGVED
jgi:hypothetical protein